MEVETYSKIFNPVLSKDEWSQIPSEIQTKLEAFVEEKFDEILTSKALYESRKNDYGNYLKKKETFFYIVLFNGHDWLQNKA